MKIYIESVIIILMLTTIAISESFSLFCPEGEEFTVCGKNDCEPTCRFPRGPKNCIDKCRPGCICYKTLVRSEKDKKCVTLEECPYNYQPRKPPSQPSETRVPPRKPEGPTSRRQGPTGGAEGPTSRLEGPKSSTRCAASRPRGPPRRSSPCQKGWPVFPPPDSGCTPGTYGCPWNSNLRHRTGRGKDEIQDYHVRPISANAPNRKVQGTDGCPWNSNLRLRTGRGKDEIQDYHVRPISANAPNWKVQGTYGCLWNSNLRLRTGRGKDEIQDYHVRPISANAPNRKVQGKNIGRPGIPLQRLRNGPVGDIIPHRPRGNVPNVKPEVLDKLLASGQYDKLAYLLGIDKKFLRDDVSGRPGIPLQRLRNGPVGDIIPHRPRGNVPNVKPEVLDKLLASGQYDKLAYLLGIDKKFIRDDVSGSKHP